MNDAHHTDTIEDYASALRAIGQDVADLLPLFLEIEVKNGQFIVRGRGLAARSKARDNVLEKLFHKVWHMLIRHDPAADIVEWQLYSQPFSLTYTKEDIERCNENGSAKRKSGTGMPEIYSLGERLRIVGRMVDFKRSHLVTLSKSLHSVSFQYLDKNGQIHLEEYSADDLYRMQQKYYAKRKTAEAVDTAPLKAAKNTLAA